MKETNLCVDSLSIYKNEINLRLLAHSSVYSPEDLLLFCKDRVDIKTCSETHLDTSLSIYDIFDTMTSNVQVLAEMCEVIGFFFLELVFF